MRCSSDNFSSTLFFCEQNNSQDFPPCLSFLGKKDRTDAEEGLGGVAGQNWKSVIRQCLDEVRASVKTLHPGNSRSESEWI